jgi:capsular exopolysaccharide synthesis family protein
LSEKVEAEQSINSLRTQIQALDDRIAELKAEAEPYYVNNPDLRGNEEQIPELAEIQRQIEGYQNRKQELTTELVARASESEDAVGEGSALGEIGALRERIEEQQLEIQQTRDEIRQLEDQMATYEDRLDRIPSQTINRQQLERRQAQAEEFYLRVADELRRTIIREESELGYVTQVRSASVPRVPISPDYQQNILLGILLGLGLGVGLAFVRHAMNQRLKEPEDIQESGYSLVGVIPQLDREIKSSFQGQETVEVNGKSISTRLMPLHEPWSPISENYRLVRTNLQYSGDGNAPKILLMTSPEPADGKTLTAVNVALSMAQSGRRTLLLDLDLRRPSTHKLLGYEQGPGIAEALEGKKSIDEVTHNTDLDNLQYISAGNISSPPPEALESDRMKELIDEFRAVYDVVIIDSPPVLAVTDPIILAPRCGATLLVVSAEDTDLRALQTAEKTLATVGVEVAGVIFNRYDPSKDASYYAGRYRYGHYSYGYERETA